MASYTTNLNLIKPASEDFYSIDDFNNNADIIDENVGDLGDFIESLEKITYDSSTENLTIPARFSTYDSENESLTISVL